MQIPQHLLSGVPAADSRVQSGGGSKFAALMAGVEMATCAPPDPPVAATIRPAIEDDVQTEKSDSAADATEPGLALSLIPSLIPESPPRLAESAVHDRGFIGGDADLRLDPDTTTDEIVEQFPHSKATENVPAPPPERHGMASTTGLDMAYPPGPMPHELGGHTVGNAAKVAPQEHQIHAEGGRDAEQALRAASMIEGFESTEARKTSHPITGVAKASFSGAAFTFYGPSAQVVPAESDGTAVLAAQAAAGPPDSRRVSAYGAPMMPFAQSAAAALRLSQSDNLGSVALTFDQRTAASATGPAVGASTGEIMQMAEPVVETPAPATRETTDGTLRQRSNAMAGAGQAAPTNAPADILRAPDIVTRMIDDAKPEAPLPRIPRDSPRTTVPLPTRDGPIADGASQMLMREFAGLPPAALSADSLATITGSEISPFTLTDGAASARQVVTAGDSVRHAAVPHVEPHRQIADAIVRTRDGAVEILLDPVELGRVTVLLGHESQPGRLGILVERPETLDLIRRHTDDLLRDLRSSGMPDAQLDFLRQDGDGRPRHHPAATSAIGAGRPPEPVDDVATPPVRPLAGSSSRLDIRL